MYKKITLISLVCLTSCTGNNFSVFVYKPLLEGKGFIEVERGSFNIPEDEKKQDTSKNIIRKVNLTTFYISKYEVTQLEYETLMGVNPSDHVTGIGYNKPVNLVSWVKATKYCNAKSKKEGLPIAYHEETGELIDMYGKETNNIINVRGYRLPTEAEWHYAAMGGNKSKGFKYSGSNDENEVG